jgi:hypothetical protein
MREEDLDSKTAGEEGTNTRSAGADIQEEIVGAYYYISMEFVC